MPVFSQMTMTYPLYVILYTCIDTCCRRESYSNSTYGNPSLYVSHFPNPSTHTCTYLNGHWIISNQHQLLSFLPEEGRVKWLLRTDVVIKPHWGAVANSQVFLSTWESGWNNKKPTFLCRWWVTGFNSLLWVHICVVMVYNIYIFCFI